MTAQKEPNLPNPELWLLEFEKLRQRAEQINKKLLSVIQGSSIDSLSNQELGGDGFDSEKTMK